jgi:predicted lipase
MKLSRYDESIDKNIIVLIFQGSQEAEDWMTNLSIKRANYFGREEVHKGFYNSLKLFLRTVKNKEFETKDNKKFRFNKDIDFINDNCKLILAGHSLGGAVATLAGCYFHDLGIKKENMTIYTFGAPPVGCEEFCSIYRKKLNLYRVVNEKDVVPKIDKLTNLRHLGKEIQLISNENEIHSCTGYIDNLIDELN